MTSLRYAIRSLRRSPGFVAISVLALGVGLGLSTTMFAVIDAVIAPHEPYHDSKSLYQVTWWARSNSGPIDSRAVYRFIREQRSVFVDVVPVTARDGMIDRGTDPTGVTIRRVSPRYFSLLGLTPTLGRTLAESDDAETVVLAHDLWRRYFGLRRDIAGATVNIDDRPHRVVGVVPRASGGPAVYVPMPAGQELVGTMIGRLRGPYNLLVPQIEVMSRKLSTQYGGTAYQPMAGIGLRDIAPQREELQETHVALLGAALVVLLIACANLAHLMLARSIARRRELALRLALGASRNTIVGQLFLEALVIAAAGTLLGALLALWGSEVIATMMPPEVQWIGLVKPQLSWRVFGQGALAGAFAAVLFGLIPAGRLVARISLDEPLKDSGGTTTARTRFRYNPLVIAEVALTLVLTVGGALLIRTVIEIARVPTDVDTRTLYRSQMFVNRQQEPRRRRPPALRNVVPPPDRHTLVSIALGVPDATDAAVITMATAENLHVTAEWAEGRPRSLPIRQYPLVTSGYFRTMGLRILRGRDFESGDGAGAGSAIIDALAAEMMYPRQDPIGKMVKLGHHMTDAAWVPIVGVVPNVRLPQARPPFQRRADDVRLDYLGRAERVPMIYVMRDADPASTSDLLLRTSRRSPFAQSQLQSRLREHPGIAWALVRPYDWQREVDLASRRFLADVFVAMALIALALAVMGVYAVMAYAVNRRLREYAIRVALGADALRLRKMVLHEALVMLLAGIGGGAFVAMAAAWSLSSLLVGVQPSDVVSLVICEAILVGVGLAAALSPARRAAHANPLEILRAS